MVQKVRGDRSLSSVRGGTLVVWVLSAAVISTVGCRGCRSGNGDTAAESGAEEEQQEEEEQERDFDIQIPQVLPSEDESPFHYVKPGHWTAATQLMTFNKDDFVGESVNWIADSRGREVPIDRTKFLLHSSRPVVLTKGRPKRIESSLLVPPTYTSLRLMSSLRAGRTGGRVFEQPNLITRLDPYQYLIVVLATEPERYTYLKSANAVKVPYDGLSEFDDTQDTVHYQVILPDISEQIPLADSPLAWTSVAYLWWDEVDPKLFTLAQELALVDWLHWGGQIVVNGPNSLDLLAGSFLDPYLPVAGAGSRSITATDLESFAHHWLIRSPKADQKALVPVRPWSAATFAVREGGRALPNTSELFYERAIGRGRIVVSAVQLSERELINWNPHFQSFLNACLLRRPARRYEQGAFGDATLLWADEAMSLRRLDARLTSNLRFFSRDLGVDTNYKRVPSESLAFDPAGEPAAFQDNPPYHAGGVGGWNDFSEAAIRARQALRDAAGVDIPDASFVIFCMAVYLVVLVPLNWLFFRAIGRVEWAWVAAPFIALANTFFVVYQAQLDIGFVRAQTEVAIMELQPGHARGHLTRYTSLYASLSTTFDIQFDNLTTMAAPLGDDDFALLRGSTRQIVNYRKHDDVRLTGISVSSNSTDLVHSEQMFSMDGAIRLGVSSRGHEQIENNSQLELLDVGVVRRTDADDGDTFKPLLEGTWIGDLDSNESRAVGWQAITIGDNGIPFAQERAAANNRGQGLRLKIDDLLRLAYDPANMDPGEVRLIGQIADVLPGETVTPATNQVRGVTLVVAHLQYGPRPAPRPDVNARADVVDDVNPTDEFLP